MRNLWGNPFNSVQFIHDISEEVGRNPFDDTIIWSPKTDLDKLPGIFGRTPFNGVQSHTNNSEEVHTFSISC